MGAASLLYEKLGRALSGVGVVVRTSSTSTVTDDPTITSGSGAPSASEPNGSKYLRTNGYEYRRIGGAWQLVTGASGTLSADTIVELTSAAGVTIDGLLLKDGYAFHADNTGTKYGNTAASPDITIAWDATKLAVTQGNPNSAIHFGISGAGIDLNLFGDTAGYDCTWDQSANMWFLADNAVLGVGNTSASPDLSVLHNGTNTLITSATGNLVIDNTSATGATFLDMGTDTSATKVAIRNNSGTELLSVTADAALASLCAMTTTDGVASGTARKIGGVASIITAAGTSHTGSTDEAVLASYVIPANTIKAGTLVRCRFLARVTADNGATTLTGRLRLGTTTLTGTELIVSSAVDTSSGHIFEGEFVLIGRAAPGAAAAIVGCGSFAQPAAAGGARITANLNTTNFATNGALRLELTADWSAADANAVQAEIFVVEVIG